MDQNFDKNTGALSLPGLPANSLRLNDPVLVVWGSGEREGTYTLGVVKEKSVGGDTYLVVGELYFARRVRGSGGWRYLPEVLSVLREEPFSPFG